MLKILAKKRKLIAPMKDVIKFFAEKIDLIQTQTSLMNLSIFIKMKKIFFILNLTAIM